MAYTCEHGWQHSSMPERAQGVAELMVTSTGEVHTGAVHRDIHSVAGREAALLTSRVLTRPFSSTSPLYLLTGLSREWGVVGVRVALGGRRTAHIQVGVWVGTKQGGPTWCMSHLSCCCAATARACCC
jgi:hypothetical protein